MPLESNLASVETCVGGVGGRGSAWMSIRVFQGTAGPSWANPGV
jgi:hypothetical protein